MPRSGKKRGGNFCGFAAGKKEKKIIEKVEIKFLFIGFYASFHFSVYGGRFFRPPSAGCFAPLFFPLRGKDFFLFRLINSCCTNLFFNLTTIVTTTTATLFFCINRYTINDWRIYSTFGNFFF